MGSRGPIRSLEEGRLAAKEEAYTEESEPIHEEIRGIEQRLNLYGASAYEAVLPVLRYWREYARDRLEDPKEDHTFWRGACFILSEMQGGRVAIQKELAAKMDELNEVRKRYGMER